MAETFESVIQSMTPSTPSGESAPPGGAAGSAPTAPGAQATPPGQPTEEQRKALRQLMEEYKDIDINEAIGDIYQLGFDWVGRKRYQEAVTKGKEEGYNKHAWELDSTQKKKAGRATLVAATLFEIYIPPKVFAVFILAMTVKDIFDNCKANEYPGEAPAKKKIARRGRADKGKPRGKQKNPKKKGKKKK